VRGLGAGVGVGPGRGGGVAGAGRGQDGRLLARRGYQVTGFDFAEAAVREARRLAEEEGVRVAFERRDVFSLAADYTEAFDAVWEYTCFCAIDPARRGKYVDVLHDVLRPGGLLFGCFYPLRECTAGPPFPVSREGIEADLAPRFDLLESAPPAASPERRRGLEWLILARRRAS